MCSAPQIVMWRLKRQRCVSGIFLIPLQKKRLNFMKLVAGSNHSNGGYISLAVSQAPMISAPRRKTTMPQISGSRFHLKGSHTFFSFPHIKIFPDNQVKVHF